MVIYRSLSLTSGVLGILDFPIGWVLFIYGGLILFFVLSLLVTIGEAIVLYRLNYGGFLRCLGVSVSMNLVSSALGYITVSFIDISRGPQGLYAGVKPITSWFLFGKSEQLPFLSAALLFLMISFPITVLSEGLVLQYFRKTHSTGTIWRMVLAANGFSYTLLAALYLLAFMLWG